MLPRKLLLKAVFRICLLIATLHLVGCGGGGDGGPGPSPGGPNNGAGWLRIYNPTDTGSFQTDRPTVTLGGNSFTPDGATCHGFYGTLPGDYQVTWSNNSTGASGGSNSVLGCIVVEFTHWDISSIPLQIGTNSITVTASDGAGNIGRDTTVVTRLPDTTPPTVVSVSPINGATDIGVNTNVSLTFSETMNSSTIIATTITLKDSAGNPVLAAVTYDYFSQSAMLVPANLLVYNTTYQGTVTTGVRDEAGGNPLAVPYTFSFTTGLNPDKTPPTVQSVSPASGSYCASPTGTVAATFSEDLDPSTVNSGTFLLAGLGSQAVTGTVSYANRTATFAPDASLATPGSFTGTLATGIKDQAGNALASPYVWNFATDSSQGVGTWAPTSYTDVPFARYGHVAVWTGSEMIVAGGLAWNSMWNQSEFTDQFGRYSPTAGTWTVGSGAPQATNQKAVWTGSRMLVWGGYNWGSVVTQGAAFDPRANAWTPMTTTAQPTARFDHTAVWTGSEMIVWGGRNSFGGGAFGNGARYNPVSDTWLPVSMTGAPSARIGHTAIWTGSEMIVWGGVGTASPPTLGDGARYNPATDTWTPIAANGAPTERLFHVAVWTGSEMIVWSDLYGSTNSGALYNPTTDSWRAMDTQCAPSGRWKAPAIWNGVRMIVWGGQTVSSFFANGSEYDPVTNSWTQLAATAAPTARAEHTAVWTGSEMIIWGGTDGSALNSGDRFAP